MNELMRQHEVGAKPKPKIGFAGYDKYEPRWGDKHQSRVARMEIPPPRPAPLPAPSTVKWTYAEVAPYDHYVPAPRRRDGWPPASTNERHWLSVDPRWPIIVDAVCHKHGVQHIDVASDRRKRSIVIARQECFYRLYSETLMSTPSIGRVLGGKDHTTVLHGIRKHKLRAGIT